MLYLPRYVPVAIAGENSSFVQPFQRWSGVKVIAVEKCTGEGPTMEVAYMPSDRQVRAYSESCKYSSVFQAMPANCRLLTDRQDTCCPHFGIEGRVPHIYWAPEGLLQTPSITVQDCDAEDKKCIKIQNSSVKVIPDTLKASSCPNLDQGNFVNDLTTTKLSSPSSTEGIGAVGVGAVSCAAVGFSAVGVDAQPYTILEIEGGAEATEEETNCTPSQKVLVPTPVPQMKKRKCSRRTPEGSKKKASGGGAEVKK